MSNKALTTKAEISRVIEVAAVISFFVVRFVLEIS